MSANAPAGTARKKKGRYVADWTNATTRGEAERSVMSHAAPTFCIQVPTFEASDAIHRLRKTERRRGDHAEG
jgi:hypothetical protein